MKKEILYNRIAKFITGNCTPEEADTITKWMNESGENEKLFNEMYQIWENTGDINKIKTFNEDVALQKVDTQLERKSLRNAETKGISLPVWIKIAAGFILIAVTVYLFTSKAGYNTPETLSFTSDDKIEKLILNDGSTVWLNKYSELKYPEKFTGEKRTVSLKGEAFFEIEKNPEKPFTVETKNANIKVLGTSFNVNARENETKTVVAVSSGKVAFNAKSAVDDKPRNVLLEKGEMALLENTTHKMEKKQIDDANITSWKTNILRFENTPFDKAMKDISNFYSKKIIVRDDTLLRMKFNSYFENQPFDVILEVLKNHAELEITDSSGIIIISKK